MKNGLTGTQLGEFTVGELIGDGGMGSVYLAKHPSYSELLAIKVSAAAVRGRLPSFARVSSAKDKC
jgi:serine/threonine protein kinase